MLTCIVGNEANCWMLNIVILYLHRKGTRSTDQQIFKTFWVLLTNVNGQLIDIQEADKYCVC